MTYPTKKERTRAKIMHAAKGLFDEYGTERVTFQMIADRADMCRTSVFNHFSGMDDLMAALTAQEIEDIKIYCEEKGLKGRELIYGLTDKLLEDTANYPDFAMNLANAAIVTRDGESPLRPIEELFRKGLMEEGTAEDETEKKIILLEGVYFGLIYHYHINGKEFSKLSLLNESHELMDQILDR